MDLMSGLLALGGMGLFSLAPLILSIVATIDVIRTGADWWWIPIVLFFPVVGSLAYFALVRTHLGGRRFATASPAAARRLQAQRRLRELAVQLAHWRGPAILAEAGEELLVLGKHTEAERHLREAQAAGAGPEEVSFPLAQALEMQGRFAEAVPLLEPLRRAKPDQRFGIVQLRLARCLDESGRAEEAEAELRDLLTRRSFFEAQVRLARLLVRRGASEEAALLLADVRASAAQLPHYLKREHRAWIRAARGNVRGDQRLPPPQVEGALPRGRRLRLALLAAGAVVALLVAAALVAGSGFWSVGKMVSLQREEEAARAELAALDAGGAGVAPPEAATVAPTAAKVRAYLAVRATVDGPAAEAVRAKTAMQQRQTPGTRVAFERAMRAKIDLLRALSAALRRERMSPSELDALLAAFDWRCLQRPEAKVLGLPPHFRGDWMAAAMQAKPGAVDDPREEPGMPGADPGARFEQMRRNARAKLADFERLTADRTLSPAAQEACTKEHDRLAATDPQAIDPLVCALDAGLYCY
jgi:hypothetical protein